MELNAVELNAVDILIVIQAIAALVMCGLVSFFSIKRLKEANNAPVIAQDSIAEVNSEKKLANGTKRTSQCLSLVGDGAVRLVGGGYLRGYRVRLEPSIWRDEPEIENIYEKIGRLLALQKPTKTVMQFRLAQDEDPGKLLKEQERNSPQSSHEIAATLQSFERAFAFGLAASGNIQFSHASLWINVPIKGLNDNRHNGFNNLFRAAKQALKNGDWSQLFSFNTDKIVRRMVADEKEAYEDAERVFRLIEQVSPLKLTRLNREETWNALYLGQNENAFVAPITPHSALTDIRPFLCGEKIDWNKTWYVLHGNTPVTMIALYRAPEEIESASLLRIITHNPTIRGRRTIVTEYVQKSVPKTKQDLKNQNKAIKKTSTTLTGGKEYTEEKLAAMQNVNGALKDFTNESQGSLDMRFYILVYGERATTQIELEKSVKQLEQSCEKVLGLLKANLDGADFARVPPENLRALYERTLLGELKADKCEWEIAETGRNLSPFVPAESCWEGDERPHTIYQTLGGKLVGINLFKNKLMGSPTVLVLGESRSGKSVLLLGLVTDILAQIEKTQVCVIDFGSSFEPLFEVLEGEYHRFNKNLNEPINVWDYDGLEVGIMPDEIQRNFVVEDALILSQTKEGTKDEQMRRGILRKCVDEVYANEVPYNRFAEIKHEPVHSHLVQCLRTFPFEGEAKRHAEELVILLEGFCGHPWIDAPTCAKYRTKNRFTGFEMASLAGFSQEIRQCMSFRVAARVNGCIGRDDDGELLPTIIVLEEVHRLADNPDFKPVLRAQKKSVREGGKEGVITLIATQTYVELEELHEIRSQAGAVFVAKQTELDELIKDRTLGEATVGAIRAVTKEGGNFSQFVLNFGKGFTQQTEVIQNNLSPVALWCRSSHKDERNARRAIKRLRPDWNPLQRVLWLAQAYPKGLVRAGLDAIDVSLVPPAPPGFEPTAELKAINTNVEAKERLSIAESAADGFNDVRAKKVGNQFSLAEIEFEAADSFDVAEIAGEAFAEFFDDPMLEIDEGQEIEQSKQLAASLGVDVPGAFIVGVHE